MNNLLLLEPCVAELAMWHDIWSALAFLEWRSLLGFIIISGCSGEERISTDSGLLDSSESVGICGKIVVHMRF